MKIKTKVWFLKKRIGEWWGKQVYKGLLHTGFPAELNHLTNVIDIQLPERLKEINKGFDEIRKQMAIIAELIVKTEPIQIPIKEKIEVLKKYIARIKGELEEYQKLCK